jgi:hypothetical protein
MNYLSLNVNGAKINDAIMDVLIGPVEIVRIIAKDDS